MASSSSNPAPEDLDLNLLIHKSAMDDSLDTTENTPDWSQLGSLWPEQDSNANTKSFNDIIDFDMASNILDMDFGMGLSGIEPSELHLDSARLAYSSYDDPFAPFPASASPADILASQFPFTFHGDTLMDTTSGAANISSMKQRRLSVTSSSSSSGPSFSPAPESIPSPEYLGSGNGYTSDSTQQSLSTEPSLDRSNHAPAAPAAATETQSSPPDFSNDPAAELAHRVRQTAGVMLAVPMNSAPFNSGQFHPSPDGLQAKLPIPRLQRPSVPSSNGSISAGSPPKSTSPSAISSAASTPPPSTPPPTTSNGVTDGTFISPSALPSSSISPFAHPSGNRPKTSHTTIERRYRTNLNARIQSLRMAVPALRVLEYDQDSKKIKKKLKGGVLIKSATPNSSNGVGTVIAVPGAPSALNPYGEVDVIDERGYVDGVKVARKCSKANVLGKAVEYIKVLKRREMRLRAEQAGLKTLVCGLVGGPALLREWEREWKEKFGGEEKDEAIEGDIEDEGEDDDEEDDDDDEGEAGRKRKRAKSEKDVFALPKRETKPALPITLSADGQPEKRKRGRPRKVPLPSENSVPTTAPTTEQPQQYLLAVFALFSFFNSPLTSSPTSNPANHAHKGHVLSPAPLPLAYAPEILAQLTPPASTVETSATWHDWVQVAHLVITVLLFLSVLGRMFGSFGLGRIRRLVGVASGAAKNAKVDEKVERMILGAEPIPTFTSSLMLYRSLSNAASPITKALFLFVVASSSSTPFLARRIVKMRARSIWDRASAFQRTKKEDVILSVSVDEAYDILSSLPYRVDGANSLNDLLATHIIQSELSRVLGKMFVREVNGKKMEGEQEPDFVLEHIIEAAKELGGNVSLLAKNIERIASPGGSQLSASESSDDDNDSEGWDSSTSLSRSITLEDDGGGGVDGAETNMPFTFLRALVLYRSLFAAPSLSVEPPTPSTPTPMKVSRSANRMQKKMYVLRKLLGSQVFDVDEVEDARDKVVDLLVEAERRAWASVLSL